jgi:hypothetical protein
MCAFSGKKKTIWPWTLVALLMIGMTAILEQESQNKELLSTLTIQSQDKNKKLSFVTSHLNHEENLSPEISLRQIFFGVLGFPAAFLQDKPFPFYSGLG